MNQREDYLRKKMETEVERRRQSEDLCKYEYRLIVAPITFFKCSMIHCDKNIHFRRLKDELVKTKSSAFFGPDSEVGNKHN